MAVQEQRANSTLEKYIATFAPYGEMARTRNFLLRSLP